MSSRKKEPPITLENITDWELGKADDEVVRRIEEDMKLPDSLVREHLSWAGGDPNTPHSRLTREHVERTVKGAGGWRSPPELSSKR